MSFIMSHFSREGKSCNLDCFKGNHMHKLKDAKMNQPKCLLVMSDPVTTILKTLKHKAESDSE
jgi:hypothetical protein